MSLLPVLERGKRPTSLTFSKLSVVIRHSVISSLHVVVRSDVPPVDTEVLIIGSGPSMNRVIFPVATTHVITVIARYRLGVISPVATPVSVAPSGAKARFLTGVVLPPNVAWVVRSSARRSCTTPDTSTATARSDPSGLKARVCTSEGVRPTCVVRSSAPFRVSQTRKSPFTLVPAKVAPSGAKARARMLSSFLAETCHSVRRSRASSAVTPLLFAKATKRLSGENNTEE